MTENSIDQDERRRELGIPVHALEEDHYWRLDGYCNCGASRSKLRIRVRASSRSRGGTIGKVNLDVVEKNSEANF